jgi:hypothetical protein
MGTPRPRPVLDCIPTRARLARLPAKLRLARPRVGALDLLYSPTLRQKSEHSMRLPATIYRHGHSRDRRGSNARVSPHFFTAHPVMGGETCHYAHLTTHCFITNHPQGRIRQDPCSTISEIRSYPSGLDPASTRSRRPALVDRKERPTRHRTPGHFTISSPTSPRCPGMAGHSWSMLLQPPLQGSTKLHLKTPRRPGLLLPYKRAGQGSKGDKRKTQARSQALASKRIQSTDQHLKQPPLYSLIFL